MRAGEHRGLALGRRGRRKKLLELILKENPVSDNYTQAERLETLFPQGRERRKSPVLDGGAPEQAALLER